MQTRLSPIATNSTRLYSEAVQALSERRFATATALAIFSIEEAAKYAILKREGKHVHSPRKRVFRHDVKHEEMGELFWYWAIYSVLSKTFEEFRKFTKTLPEVNRETMKLIAGLSSGEAVDFLRYEMFKSEDEMRAYVKASFAHPELLEIAALGKSGVVEALRRKCLYVDLSPDGSAVASTPQGITEAEAKKWFEIAWFGQEYITLANKVWC